MIRHLLKQKRVDLYERDYYGRNCLMLACENNPNLEVIRFLISVQKMDISDQDYEGQTAKNLCNSQEKKKILFEGPL